MDYNSSDITKLVINNQEKTELHRSFPLKTYSKKLCDTSPLKDGLSRYGRKHKRNVNQDFLSTDIKVGNYLKTDSVSRKHYFKGKPLKKLKCCTTSSPVRGRGRPRKSLQPIGNSSYVPRSLNLSAPDALFTEYQAPTPTSTETLPLPMELKKEEPLSEDSGCEDADWNCGDLAWASIGGFPYWPCAITRDPVEKLFRKSRCIGRSVQPSIMLHVRFFGDNGRRSWVKSNHVMGFQGLEHYQSVTEDMCTGEMKKRDLKTYKMYVVGCGMRKAWQAAVSEAESLLASPRSERILYFMNMFPERNEVPVMTPLEPKKRGRKRKSEVEGTASKEGVVTPSKQMKVEVKQEWDGSEVLASALHQTPLTPPPITPRAIYMQNNDVTNNNKSVQGSSERTSIDIKSVKRPYVKKSDYWKSSKKESNETPMPEDTPVKEEQSPSSCQNTPGEETPKRGRGRPRKCSNTPESPKTPVSEVATTPEPSPSPRGRGRPPGSTKKRKLEARAATKPPETRAAKQPETQATTTSRTRPRKSPVAVYTPRETRSSPSKSLVSLSKFKAYCEQHRDRVAEEHPTLTPKEVNKYLQRMWTESSQKTKYRSRVAEESQSDSDEKDVRGESPTPLATPTSSKVAPSKRIPSIFTGIRLDRVCQVCLKGGEIVRCRGPCNGHFHRQCGLDRTPLKEEESEDKSKTKVKKVKSKLQPEAAAKPDQPVLANTKTKSSPHHPVKKESSAKNQTESETQEKQKTRSKRLSEKLQEEAKSQEQPSQEQEDGATKSVEKLEASPPPPTTLTPPASDNSQETPLPLSNGPLTKPEDIEAEKSDSHKSDSDSEPKLPGKINGVRSDSKSSTSDTDNELTKSKEAKWMCGVCSKKQEDPCFICYKEGGEGWIRCTVGNCGHGYHERCLDVWPQSVQSVGCKGRPLLQCPQHSCHTCISDNPKANLPKLGHDRLVRCLRCPTSYHHSNYCVPAGTEILSNNQIICPRHYNSNNKSHHINAAWCALCSVGGLLVCCEFCPNSFHAECLKMELPKGRFMCEDCETGRYPLYGDIVWVKLGTYRWWPARILFPAEVPENINQLSHKKGEFAVKFFGTHDHYWVNRGRVFFYHEGDGNDKSTTKSNTDRVFNLAVKESAEAFTKHLQEKLEREAVSKPAHKPPKYIKIQCNRFVGGTRQLVESEENNPTPCECRPEHKSPCGPDSDCINRLLLIECDPQLCPAKDKCMNQNFEKRNYPPLTTFKTDDRGWGLKTLVPLKKGDFVIEYVGEVIDDAEYKKRLDQMLKSNNQNFYFLTIDREKMLDAGPRGNKARFMNHSCEPNCVTQKWTVNGSTRVGLFTLKEVPADSELVFNYQLETVGDNKVECRCGAATCAGFIGGKPLLNPKNSTKKSEVKGKGKKGKKAQKKVSRHKTNEDCCFTCGMGGELLLCDSPSCPKSYHLSCLGLTKQPKDWWSCPWHQCSMCSQTKVKRCTLCINSYCDKHAHGNISLSKRYGLLCNNHSFSESGSESGSETKSSKSRTDSNSKTAVKEQSNSKMGIKEQSNSRTSVKEQSNSKTAVKESNSKTTVKEQKKVVTELKLTPSVKELLSKQNSEGKQKQATTVVVLRKVTGEERKRLVRAAQLSSTPLIKKVENGLAKSLLMPDSSQVDTKLVDTKTCEVIQEVIEDETREAEMVSSMEVVCSEPLPQRVEPPSQRVEVPALSVIIVQPDSASPHPSTVHDEPIIIELEEGESPSDKQVLMKLSDEKSVSVMSSEPIKEDLPSEATLVDLVQPLVVNI